MEVFYEGGLNSFEEGDILGVDYVSPIWAISVGNLNWKIDWRVRFGDGLLTDRAFADTWKIFRSWLILQVHPRFTGGYLTDPAVKRGAINRVTGFIDYLLLHQDKYKLPQFGLSALTENDVLNILRDIESHADEAAAFYNWKRKLAQWLDSVVDENEPEIERELEKNKELQENDLPIEDWVLTPDSEKVLRWRAALSVKRLYSSKGHPDFKRHYSSTKISKVLLKDTLRGQAVIKPLYRELCYAPVERTIREKDPVPVRSDDVRPTEVTVRSRRRAFFSLELLAEAGMRIPVDVLVNCKDKRGIESKSIRALGRYATVPFKHLMAGIRNGIDMVYDHSEKLFDAYVCVLSDAIKRKMAPAALVQSVGVQHFLSKDVLNLGVAEWSLSSKISGASSVRLPGDARINETRVAQYFSDFRANRGMVELLRVMVGAMEYDFGAMTARRQGELIDLTPQGALDETGRYVGFKNRKSGAHGLRQFELRPAPPLCRDIVELSKKLHLNLEQAGVKMPPHRLFDLPGVAGIRAVSTSTYNEALDAFCDYVSFGLDSKGRRWYVRQHQLRRFFALAFFYGTKYGNVSTLRWMLGHSDAEHVWHYITGSVPGEILDEVRSYFLADVLTSGSWKKEIEISESAFCKLGDATQTVFGTRNFSLIDSDTFELFIAGLLRKGLSVNPHFISDASGKSYRIAVTFSEGWPR
ncbi:hypothetical protein TSA66_22940 [Noviherbaspirillum autotrophicum]|uniref:Uncharacterized protein n=1 Tax=Noviherbaspirillum autotrophicum TaxID=709839 RepID=A0A0C1YR07_9BURK|nr:hypothetical protein TSA66_22940 [Noviherbaspirillum autotrophicum]